jgi:AcrR family transcriptional regulator
VPRRRAEPRKQPQQPRSRDTVEVILAGTQRILARDGVDGLTTARIAEAAGISVGSLYQYFPNKEAICGAMIERMVEQYYQVTTIALAAVRAMPAERAFRAVIDGLLQAFRHNARAHSMLFDLMPVSGRDALYRSFLARHAEAVTSALRERGAEVRQPPELVAQLLLCITDGVTRAVAFETDEARIDALIREAVELCVTYLRPPA